jgi:hypothetical protein
MLITGGVQISGGVQIWDIPIVLTAVTANLSMNLDAATYTSGLTWTDSSGNGKNANIAGAVTTYTLGTGFNVIRFNGSAYANAYLGFGTTLNTTAGYTFEVWAQPAASSTSYTLVGEWDVNTVNGGWTDAQMGFLSNNRISAGYYNGGAAIASAAPVTAGGTWYQIVFTYNGASNGNLFVNGSKVATTGQVIKSNPTATFLSLGKSDGFGFYIGGVINNFTGNIGAWRVYNRNLSDAEITQNFDALRGRYGL